MRFHDLPRPVQDGATKIQVLPIHFDVPGHAIPLTTFVRTSAQTEAIIRSLNRELFEGRLAIEVVVLPPEDGTFLARLGVILGAGFAAIAWFVESDIGKGFLKGLTDHEPAYWAEQLGEGVRSSAEALVEAGEVQRPAESEYGALLVSEMAKSFLRKDNDELVRAGITPTQFRDAFEAKNEFYQACAETPDLRAIGFSEAADFPIRRSDFVRLRTVLPPKPDEEVEPPWSVGTIVLKVTSPNWDRDDRTRRWKGRDQQGRDRYFRIEDDAFWRRVSTDAISTHFIDVMTVQWAFQGRPEQPKNCRVLRVLEFNGSRLSEPLSDDELVAELGRLAEQPQDQWDLFDAD